MSVGCLSCRRRVAHNRGLCSACYRKARGLVAAGEATWEQLVRQGQALPPRPKVRPPWGPKGA
jgi:NMD protein affecting ribosome stability and mRNA decay